MKNPIPFLRAVGLAEAVSFLLLLGIAMPLKYFAGMPIAVKIVGSIHGALFVLFSVTLIRVMWIAGWPFARGLLVWVAALLPFGPFVMDRKVREYSDEFVRKAGT